MVSFPSTKLHHAGHKTESDLLVNKKCYWDMHQIIVGGWGEGASFGTTSSLKKKFGSRGTTCKIIFQAALGTGLCGVEMAWK